MTQAPKKVKFSHFYVVISEGKYLLTSGFLFFLYYFLVVKAIKGQKPLLFNMLYALCLVSLVCVNVHTSVCNACF